MELIELAAIAGVFFVFALISNRIAGSPITPPMIFTAAGLIASETVLRHLSVSFSDAVIHTIAELTLILVLAADASTISLKTLMKYRTLPVRMLGICLPLIILTGTLIGYLIYPEKGWLYLALLASILAPTDAALGASVLSNKDVPVRVRQSLNVESGLNDGIALPAVLFFACFFNLHHQSGETNWIAFLVLQLSLGPLVGFAVGYIGGTGLGYSAKRSWITTSMQGVGALALAVLSFALSELIGGNGFIAAFVCGLTYGNLRVGLSNFLQEFTETESQMLTYLTFFIFGLAILPHALAHANWLTLVYALASLTIVRMLPVLLATIGSGLRLPTIAFLGWFGPRGLASLLFALLVLEDLQIDQATELQTIVAVTVLLSILLHGASAGVLSRTYARWAHKETTSDCPENFENSEGGKA